ncbi:MAG: hypothetical protein U0L72_01415, partial [Acutalibacteraceae bacterium]|nr:hypothetical protein [Acutalibacteraceae bacterium]
YIPYQIYTIVKIIKLTRAERESTNNINMQWFKHIGKKIKGHPIRTPFPNWNASIDTILAFFFFCKIPHSSRLFGTFENEISFIVGE